jgi:hypothetical protein
VSKGRRFVLCIDNRGHEESLEPRKLYHALPTTSGERRLGVLRVIDESGEDCLYPAAMFMPVTLSPKIRSALAAR